MPQTKYGKWALYTFVLMIALFIVGNLIMNMGGRAPENVTTGVNWPIIPGFVAGLIAAGLAIFAIAKEKERSIVAFLIPIILLLLLFFGTIQAR